jgi:hypothetical protein
MCLQRLLFLDECPLLEEKLLERTLIADDLNLLLGRGQELVVLGEARRLIL